MMDWREVGNELFAEVRKQWLNLATASMNRAAVDLSVPGFQMSIEPTRQVDASPGFTRAVYAWENGDPADLIHYLRSDKPLNKRDRERLVLGIKFMSGRPNHRPANNYPKFAASLAVALYKEWCERNRKANVSSRGYARHMQDACADLMADILHGIDADQIRALMNDKGERRVGDGGYMIRLGNIDKLKADLETHQRKFRQK
jgi:hypothetical protein